eukprot:ANDGO_05697.mRNA.1 hypothetical protein
MAADLGRSFSSLSDLLTPAIRRPARTPSFEPFRRVPSTLSLSTSTIAFSSSSSSSLSTPVTNSASMNPWNENIPPASNSRCSTIDDCMSQDFPASPRHSKDEAGLSGPRPKKSRTTPTNFASRTSRGYVLQASQSQNTTSGSQTLSQSSVAGPSDLPPPFCVKTCKNEVRFTIPSANLELPDLQAIVSGLESSIGKRLGSAICALPSSKRDAARLLSHFVCDDLDIQKVETASKCIVENVRDLFGVVDSEHSSEASVFFAVWEHATMGSVGVFSQSLIDSFAPLDLEGGCASETFADGMASPAWVQKHLVGHDLVLVWSCCPVSVANSLPSDFHLERMSNSVSISPKDGQQVSFVVRGSSSVLETLPKIVQLLVSASTPASKPLTPLSMNAAVTPTIPALCVRSSDLFLHSTNSPVSFCPLLKSDNKLHMVLKGEIPAVLLGMFCTWLRTMHCAPMFSEMNVFSLNGFRKIAWTGSSLVVE